MRKEYGVALRDLFTELLGSACPLFEWVKKPSILAGVPGERAYRWIVAENEHAWVVLVPHQKREAFTIELGWSRESRFPQLTMRPSLAHPKNAGPGDEYLCRLGELARGTDWWWTIEELPLFATQDQIMDYIVAQTKPISPETARSRVMPHVQEAIEEFQRFGLPFLRTHILSGGSIDPLE
jgi:hypothetical protein